MNNITNNKPKIFAKYRHYKGELYQILGFCMHSKNGEELVYYQALYGNCIFWARPINLFCAEVEINGNKRPRFELVEY